MIKNSVPEMELLEQMAENALFDNYLKNLRRKQNRCNRQTRNTNLKIGKGSDLEFKIITAVIPELNLPDYKKISQTKQKKRRQ